MASDFDEYEHGGECGRCAGAGTIFTASFQHPQKKIERPCPYCRNGRVRETPEHIYERGRLEERRAVVEWLRAAADARLMMFDGGAGERCLRAQADRISRGDHIYPEPSK